MKLFNEWVNRHMPRDAWDVYRALYPLPGMRPHKVPGKPRLIEYQGTDAIQYMAAKPAHIQTEVWMTFHRLIVAGLKGGNTYPLEAWVLAGFCHHGPRVYRPTLSDWRTLSTAEVNVPFSEYRQPYEVLTVAMPDRDDGWHVPGFGRVAAVTTRLTEGVIGMIAWGIDALDEKGPKNMNVFFTWDDVDDVIEHRLRWMRGPDFVPSFGSDGWSEVLNRDEATFFDACKRVAFNAGLLLSSYGHAECEPNPRYARRCRETLAKKTAPDGAKRQASFDLHRMGMAVSLARSVTLREHRLTTLPGEPTGRHVRPHWRRGHWANVRVGPGRLGTRRVFRAELFVNLHVLGGNSPRPATVVYRADANLPTRGQNAPADPPTPEPSGNSP